MLIVTDAGKGIALDTCSEISIGSIQVLKNIRLTQKAVCVEGIGGTKIMELEGDISLADKTEITLFCVDPEELPPGTQVLLGLSSLKSLAVSLDFVLEHPGCELQAARDHARTCSEKRLNFGSLTSLFREGKFFTLLCLAVFGLCLGLAPHGRNEKDSASFHLVSPLIASLASALYSFLGLLGLVCLIGFACALLANTPSRIGLMPFPVETEIRDVRDLPQRPQRPRASPHLSLENQLLMESLCDFHPGVYAHNFCPQSNLGGLAPHTDFNLQRQMIGAISSVATISEKFALLAKSRTPDAPRRLETKRCFSIRLTPHELSRQSMARGLLNTERKKRLALGPPPREASSTSTTGMPDPSRTVLVARLQGIRDSQPDLSNDEADAAWETGSEHLFGEARHLSSVPDVSSFTGGNTIKVTVEVHHSSKVEPIRAKVALDTQSDVT
jgi:hypothetical protein